MPVRLTAADERHIVRIARREPKLTYRALQEAAGVNVHNRTIGRHLAEYGIKNWRAKKRPKLLEVHAQLRLEFARRHQNWTVAQWRNVIFLDECSLERGSGKETTWVFRTPTQKWDHEMIEEVYKGKDIVQMFWAGF